MSAYCFPPTDEIAKCLAEQSGSHVTFKSRGLTDGALLHLLTMLLTHDKCEVDLSYNALTEKSLPLLEDAQKAGFTFRLDHNVFNTQSPRSHQIITPPQQPSLQPLQQSPFQPPQVNLQVSLPVPSYPEMFPELGKKLESLTEDVKDLTKNVNSLTDTVKIHEAFIKKLAANYEKMILACVLQKFPSFQSVNKETQSWAKNAELQFDLLLVSDDGTKVLIGEIKSHLTMSDYTKARQQLSARMSAIKGVQQEEDVCPAEFRNLKEYFLLLGCEMCDGEVRNQVDRKDFLLVIPSGGRYIITRKGQLV